MKISFAIYQLYFFKHSYSQMYLDLLNIKIVNFIITNHRKINYNYFFGYINELNLK